jgi:Protein of unknown function (DUF2946)
MKLTLSDRSLVAWTLYFCVLFNVFACGLGHGQMMGFELNGVGSKFCSSLDSKNPVQNTDITDQPANDWAGSLSCPICSAVTLSIAFLFCLTWLLQVGQRPRPSRELRCKAPPRYSWPSANPRASPQV